jgi:hypothetical protein
MAECPFLIENWIFQKHTHTRMESSYNFENRHTVKFIKKKRKKKDVVVLLNTILYEFIGV